MIKKIGGRQEEIIIFITSVVLTILILKEGYWQHSLTSYF